MWRKDIVPEYWEPGVAQYFDMSPCLPLGCLLSGRTVTRLLVKALASAECVAVAGVRGRGMVVYAAMVGACDILMAPGVLGSGVGGTVFAVRLGTERGL